VGPAAAVLDRGSELNFIYCSGGVEGVSVKANGRQKCRLFCLGCSAPRKCAFATGNSIPESLLGVFRVLLRLDDISPLGLHKTDQNY